MKNRLFFTKLLVGILFIFCLDVDASSHSPVSCADIESPISCTDIKRIEKHQMNSEDFLQEPRVKAAFFAIQEGFNFDVTQSMVARIFRSTPSLSAKLSFLSRIETVIKE